MVAAISRREVIIVDSGKLVDRLGVRFLLPVEVIPFARNVVAARLEAMGATPTVRTQGSGTPRRTDNSNEILDCRFPDGIPDAAALEAKLARIPGVVESGLFVGLAHTLVIGAEGGGVEVRERP